MIGNWTPYTGMGLGKGGASVISMTPESSNGVRAHVAWNVEVTGLVAVEAPQ